jgi:hypothetical protein
MRDISFVPAEWLLWDVDVADVGFERGYLDTPTRWRLGWGVVDYGKRYMREDETCLAASVSDCCRGDWRLSFGSGVGPPPFEGRTSSVCCAMAYSGRIGSRTTSSSDTRQRIYSKQVMQIRWAIKVTTPKTLIRK